MAVDQLEIQSAVSTPKTQTITTDRIMCTRCLYSDSTPSISFNEAGVCNYCKIHDEMDAEYPVGDEGEKKLHQLADRIRHQGRRCKYDVVVGVSGGCDSSYMLYKTKELGLRPLAAHFDNTWNSAIATQNIHNVLKALDVDLFTYVVDNEEYDDLYRSFLRAGVPDIDTPTDIALASTLYMAAAKHGVKYIFEGHSFRSEGIAPIGWIYMDGKYIQSVQKEFGTRMLKTFPNLSMASFVKYSAVNRIKRIRPLYYMDYQKEEAKTFMSRELGWKWYGGHHLENRFTQFLHNYFLPQRFNVDFRVQGYSALVRSGQMSREQGQSLLRQPHPSTNEIVEYVKKRLRLSDQEFEDIMTKPTKSYRDYRTYKRTFERLRPLFWLLYRLDLVPKSFYIKYTSKTNI